MAVVGIQATVFYTGNNVEVRYLYDEVDKLDSMPIIDADLAYDWPKSLNAYLLIFNNALHILSM